jgi:fructose-bisphosphate aldolase class I
MYEKMLYAPGFIAALDQSGGSTPKALKLYGIPDSAYVVGNTSMYDQVHEMRTRIMTSNAFNGERILATILFADTVRRNIHGKPTAKYLWEEKGIVPIIKIDEGLEDEHHGVQLMKNLSKLNDLLDLAHENEIFGTKARSVIKLANADGIRAIVQQQLNVGKAVIRREMVPILEPEVDIHSPEKEAAEEILRNVLLENLNLLAPDEKVMLKLTLPTKPNLYKEVIAHPNVVRVVALSGGYTRAEANELLAKNENMVASFSRALTEGLTANDSTDEFEKKLDESIGSIYFASVK